jgi:riboflavin kinase/FMN adenylyltransferase
VTGFYRVWGLESAPEGIKGAMVAIGNFDGLHRGHQHVLTSLRERARAAGVPALMLTFEPHPRDVFAPTPFMFRLTTGDAKARIAEALGLDGIVIMPFNREFSQITADEFVARFLIGALGVRGVTVGADFHFGFQRKGTPEFLKGAGAAAGFDVEILDLLDEGDDHVSSSRIRNALGAGEVREANQLLGYHWFFSGKVALGDQRGRTLGFPTANTPTPTGFGLAQGIYAVRAKLGDRLLDGVAAYGKPMFNNERPPFETVLFDFDQDIYGEELAVALVAHIRGQMVFAGLDGLIAQMHADAKKARDLLGRCSAISDLDRKLRFFPG